MTFSFSVRDHQGNRAEAILVNDGYRYDMKYFKEPYRGYLFTVEGITASQGSMLDSELTRKGVTLLQTKWSA